MNVGSGELLIVALSASDQDTHKEVMNYLVDSGLRSTLVTTEETCLTKIQDLSPDLIIYFLWNSTSLLDSSEFIQTIKTSAPDVAIIAIAQFSDTKLVQPALVKGADDYLISPIADYALLDHIVAKNLRLSKERSTRMIEGQKLAGLNQQLEESLRVLERDQRAGFEVQLAMLPKSPYKVGDVTFTHKIIPSVILSGDFIDYFKFADDRLLFYIADVSGHGASSAFVTVLLKNLSQRLSREYERLGLNCTAAILEWFNQELLSSELAQHVTMFMGIVDVDRGVLEYSNAAHFPGTIFSSKEKTEFLEIGGLPLGLYENPSYETNVLELPSQFTLVMFSDGIFDVMQQQTLKAKEDFLLGLVEDGTCTVGSLSDHLGLGVVKDAPDDIALFTIARAA
ncbi:MAG: SpoIIE family protein phosphatase [Gammaproteobacteria bacterium]|nr:SpoIIE family protein phosphatase [Gammaproteobacteria bacterium]